MPGKEEKVASLATRISHVEVAFSLDDGFEFFGGTVNVDHLSSLFIGDDAFDADAGYQGHGQFLFSMLGAHGSLLKPSLALSNEDSAPSARLVPPRAQATPTYPRAPQEKRGREACRGLQRSPQPVPQSRGLCRCPPPPSSVTATTASRSTPSTARACARTPPSTRSRSSARRRARGPWGGAAR